MKCPSCDGAGYVIQDEEPCHMTCGECAGTGNGLVAEAARGIQYQFRHLLGGESDARASIARYVASAVMGAGRERGMGDEEGVMKHNHTHEHRGHGEHVHRHRHTQMKWAMYIHNEGEERDESHIHWDVDLVRR